METRYRIPDSLIGIGGAGRAIVESFMEEEYILDEIIRPREDTSTEHNLLRAFVIDTDTDTKGKARSEENRIKQKISRVAGKYDRPVQEISPQYEYINLVDSTDRMRIQPENLTKKPNVPEIADANGITCWWLRKSDHMIGVSDEYTNGVDRRRGLSKALLHASQVGENPIENVIDQASTADYCALVAGLGGGTGSGMYLDISKQLRENGVQNLTLFGILPQLDEGDNVKANAFGALSELERLALDNKNPFDNIILIPYEPAANDSEFDEAVTKVILSYYNIDNNHPELQDLTEGLTNHTRKLDESNQGDAPRFAPFTVAIPQILYYAAEEVEKSRDRIEEFIENKREAIEAENNLYDTVENFIEKYCSEGIANKLTGEGSLRPESLTREQTLDLRENRISPLKQLLGLDTFEQLGYDSASQILNVIERVETEVERKNDSEDSVEIWAEKLQRIPSINEDTVDLDENVPTAEENRMFAELVLDELNLIGRRRDILKTVNLIEDPVIKQGIESALDEEIDGIAGTKPEEEMQKIDIMDLQHELNDLETLIDAAQELHADLIDEWKSSTRNHMESLVAINAEQADIEELINEFRSKVRTDIQTINNATRSEELPAQMPNYQKFYHIDEYLRENDCESIDVKEIEEDVQKILSAAENWHAAGKSGIINSLLRVITGNSTATQDMYIEKAGRINKDLFQLSSWDANTFHCEFVDEGFDQTISDIKSTKQDHIKAIKTTIRDTIPSTTTRTERLESFINENDQYKIDSDISDLLDETSREEPDYEDRLNSVENTLADANGVHKIFQNLSTSDGAVYDILWDTLVKPIEELHNQREEYLEDKRSQEEMYENLHEIIRTESATFVNRLANVQTPSQIGATAKKSADSFAHKKEVITQERGKLLGRENIAEANLWESPNEPIRIHDIFLQNFVDRLTDSRYTALRKGSITDETQTSRGYEYGGHRIISVLMSRAFEDADNVRNQLTTNDGNIRQMKDEIDKRVYFPEGQDQYAESIVPFGDDWDISMTMFIGGVFLDNLLPVDSYMDKYQTEHDLVGDDITIRHTHGIDGKDTMGAPYDFDGAYVYRADLVNLNTGNVNIFTSEDVDTAEKIRTEYQQVVGFNSTVDLNLSE